MRLFFARVALACVAASSMGLPFSQTFADQTLPGADQQDQAGPRASAAKRGQYSVDRWDYGLDVKLTDLFQRKATDVNAPTVILSAQWNYRVWPMTFIGLQASGTPQSHADKIDGVKRSFTAYYGGLNISQNIVETPSFRLAAALALGRGIVFVRISPDVSDAVVGSARYNVVEPSVFATFLRYNGLDIGAVGSYRLASLIETSELVEAKDLTSMAFGVTFRTAI